MRQKSMLVIVVMLSALPSVGLAQRKYGTAGCGLGASVFGRNGFQLGASTTNGSFSAQYFGITSGTSNCVPDKASAAAMRQDEFMTTNYASLSKEMAQGRGETLKGLALTLGCPAERLTDFNKFAQSNYKDIYEAPGALAALDTLKDILAEQPNLSNSCTLAKAE